MTFREYLERELLRPEAPSPFESASVLADFVVDRLAHYVLNVPQPTSYVVVCKDRGRYALATRLVFDTREDAETYADTVDSSLVVEGCFARLRFNASR